MDRTTQLALLDRVMAHRAAGNTTDLAPSMYRNPVATYLDTDRYEQEIERLFRHRPVLACMSGDVAGPGDSITLTIAETPVVVVRGEDGVVRAFRNVCRHRGACVAEGRATGAKLLTCPYHAWSYRLDGRLVNPTHRDGFAGLERDQHGLAELGCDEAVGLVFVQVDAAPGTVDATAWLGGMGSELAPFGLEGHRFVARRETTRDMNWKLMYDTFCEPYHIRHLHTASIAPYIQSDNSVSDRFGVHARIVAPRWKIDELDAEPRARWELLPYATINYFLVPNTIMIYQQDHVQLFQLYPEGVGRTRSVTTIYAPADAAGEEHRPRWQKSLDIIVDVIDREDYAMCEQIQRSFRSGAQSDLVFGRNEPCLIYFHEAIEQLLWGVEVRVGG